MAREAGQNNNSNIQKSTVESYDKHRSKLQLYAYIGVSAMIISVVLIMLDIKIFNLVAGVIIIIASILGMYLIRKAIRFSNSVQDSLYDVSSSNEKKDDVITDFSHKIREPLNNMVIITDLLMESGLQKKQKDLLETFVASTKNMVTILNELTMQSAENLSFESRKHIRFNLLSTIQNTIELYNLKDKANIDFILNKKEFGDFECLGDPIILKQIFLDVFNTIENQYSERATKVTISLKREKEAAFENIIGVRIQTDRKIVLIDENKPALSLAAKLISSGKGTFSQELGANYTVLNITLPYAKVVREAKHQIASPKIEELIQKDKIHKELKDIKILLVEDNLINQKITHLTLKPLVNNIDTASNGREALDKFGTAAYDIILMDIQMPVMSGLVAAEKIRALEVSTNTHVPIIAITANAMIGDKEKCISAGIDDYISKPFQPSALIEKIKKFI
jgi:CheY-like chemotaxis protein